MGINIDKAYEVGADGFAVSDDDGNILFYLTGGSGSPIGSAAPVPTVFIDQATSEMWRKVGPGVNDWTLLEWDKNFSFSKINELLTIKDNQEMLTRGVEITETGGLCITENSGVAVIKGE